MSNARSYRRTAAMIAALVTYGLAIPAGAASLHVSPVNLRLEPGQMATGVSLTNPGNQPVVAQVRVFSWGQTLNDDYLTPQQELIASPPIVSIPAHGEQFVRVVRLDHATLSKEMTYRLLVDQLPDPNVALDSGAVDIRLRYSIPLFVMPPATPSAPRLTWMLDQHDGASFLKIMNTGGTHAQLSGVKLLEAAGAQSVSDGLLGYALAGSVREWRLPAGLTPTHDLRVAAKVNGIPVEADATQVPGTDR